MNRVVHFEIHAKDLERMERFYEEVFGWQIQDLGPQMGHYRMVTTGSNEPDQAWPGINGGMNPRRGDVPLEGAAINAFVCTVEVADIDETLRKVEAAGGTVGDG